MALKNNNSPHFSREINFENPSNVNYTFITQGMFSIFNLLIIEKRVWLRSRVFLFFNGPKEIKLKPTMYC